tara:strand:+ start:395 stop:523 length:129 start_codon:yes stop_codon:yes gene_type:complete
MQLSGYRIENSKSPDGKKVAADYWSYKTKPLEPNYWDKKLKK